MRHRYSNWVEGLNGDWLVSRQRYFGVPVPVWYPLDAHGEIMHDNPIVPDETVLPIDPSTDVPAGYTAEQRGVAGGFIGDPDVMDTWATSSLTPQIAAKWEDDSDLFSRVYPFDLRPQAHDIIRTWLFSTMVRSHFEHGMSPWSNAAMSGWILDPDRKKMSKSKGNVVTPVDLFEQYGSDAVRYWAAGARPGIDTAFSEDQMKVGRKLATKLLNVTKFVLGFGDADETNAPTHHIDAAMLRRLSTVVDECTTAFENYDYARVLERTESFFWWFCDDYVELVKTRAYGESGNVEGAASARAALRRALSTLQRLFAPILPFATEEVWSWWQTGSIHKATWPVSAELTAGLSIDADDLFIDAVCGTLALIRRAKTEAKVSQRAIVELAEITASDAATKAITAGWEDIANAGSVTNWTSTIADVSDISVAVTLAPPAE
jgi:valyl-tRNA synthetase